MSKPAVASELSIQSARGAIGTDRLGRTLMHEHVFTVSSEMAANYPAIAWDGTREDRISEAIEKLNHLKATGIDSFVDMNVLGLGRSLPEILAVAENVELNILLATGIYPDRGLPQAIEKSDPKAGAQQGSLISWPSCSCRISKMASPGPASAPPLSRATRTGQASRQLLIAACAPWPGPTGRPVRP